VDLLAWGGVKACPSFAGPDPESELRRRDPTRSLASHDGSATTLCAVGQGGVLVEVPGIRLLREHFHDGRSSTLVSGTISAGRGRDVQQARESSSDADLQFISINGTVVGGRGRPS